MEIAIPILVALALVFVAWKVLAGLVKMVAIVAVLALAGAWYFGFGGMA